MPLETKIALLWKTILTINRQAPLPIAKHAAGDGGIGAALGEESSERSRRVSRPVYHQFPARIGIHDVLLDMAGRTALPSSMEQEIWCQRYIIVVDFLLHNKSELE